VGHALHIVAAALFAVAAATPPRAIAPVSDRALALSQSRNAYDVTWANDRLLVATDRGVYALSRDGGAATEVIHGLPLPEGLPEPEELSSDGKSVAAVSWASHGAFNLRLADRKRLVAQRSVRLIPLDVALRGDRACLLAFAPAPPSDNDKSAAVWCGSPSDSWGELKPLHRLHSEHARDLFRSSLGSYDGAIAVESDGTLDVVTSSEPGLYRYGADGRLTEVLGQSMDELVLEGIKEVTSRFAGDLENRYRLLLNAQPTIDDLVVTPRGPAILVRLSEGEKIVWELWYPSRSGGVAERLRLGIDRIGPYGHLRCEARDAELACVGSMPPRAEAAQALTAQAWPHLWLFHLPGKERIATR
jgi:hypothetical protein